jgi:hypothetical protein
MNGSSKPKRPFQAMALGLGLLLAVTATGCQVSMNGQTLPSPYYGSDDIQYYAPGPEFKLAREAAAQSAAQAEYSASPRGRTGANP